MIKPLNNWKKTHKDLEKTDKPIWSMNLANWYNDNITGISPDPLVLNAVGFIFTFNTALFATNLSALPPVLDPVSGVMGIAMAWEAAIMTTVFPATLMVGTGSTYGAPTPATTFGVVTSVILDPASVQLGKLKIMELASAKPVSKEDDSPFPEKFREATLQLKINVIGMNMLTPPAGPTPLVAMQVPLT